MSEDRKTDTGPYRAQPAAGGELGVADTVKAITSDVQQLVRTEIELAKAELLPSAKTAGTGAGLFGGAGVFGLYALGLLFFGLSWLIGESLGRVWLGFLAMTVLLLIIAGILFLVGRAKLKQADFSASRTKASAAQTAAAVKGAVAAVTNPDQPALGGPTSNRAMERRPGSDAARR